MNTMKIDEALRLYNMLGDTELKDPINWLLYQKEERTKWEEYKKIVDTEKSKQPLRKEIEMQEEKSYKYREFMYDNYNRNFRHKLIIHGLNNAFGIKCDCSVSGDAGQQLCKEIHYIRTETDYMHKYKIFLKIRKIKRQVATLAKQRLLDMYNIPLHIKELPSDKWEYDYFQKINLQLCPIDKLVKSYHNILAGMMFQYGQLNWLKDLSTQVSKQIVNRYETRDENESDINISDDDMSR